MVGFVIRPLMTASAWLWICHASVAAQSPTPLTAAQRAYVDFAMRTNGDAIRGRLMFTNELRAGCTKCHSVDGSSSTAGPDLTSIGDKLPRRELIRAVMEPSAEVEPGDD